jgi:DNA helicase-2/ATP-dependent DNA helicase PcrA
VADVDDWEAEIDRVTMMTLHAAKGLEFPVVFIVAVEENVLPHERNVDDPGKLEEERRLLFVGITRAEEELHLSAAQQRSFRGRTTYAATSSFLMELPRDEMDVIGQLGYGSTEFEPPVIFLDGGVEDSSPVDWEVDDHQPEPRRARRRRVRAKPPIAPMTTAADMVGDTTEVERCSPEAFHRDMIVTHPEYGLGKIIAVGGVGAKRSATVQFAGPAGKKRFRLAFSPLRPAKG